MPFQRKGPWTNQEDMKLREWVNNEGPNKWSLCAKKFTNRTGKQCRDRWINILDPALNKSSWSAEEDYTIFTLFDRFGGVWSKFVPFFKGRTDYAIKNRFYACLRKTVSKTDRQLGRKSDVLKLNICDLMHFFPECLLEKKEAYLKSKELSSYPYKEPLNGNWSLEENFLSTASNNDTLFNAQDSDRLHENCKAVRTKEDEELEMKIEQTFIMPKLPFFVNSNMEGKAEVLNKLDEMEKMIGEIRMKIKEDEQKTDFYSNLLRSGNFSSFNGM